MASGRTSAQLSTRPPGEAVGADQPGQSHPEDRWRPRARRPSARAWRRSGPAAGSATADATPPCSAAARWSPAWRSARWRGRRRRRRRRPSPADRAAPPSDRVDRAVDRRWWCGACDHSTVVASAEAGGVHGPHGVGVQRAEDVGTEGVPDEVGAELLDGSAARPRRPGWPGTRGCRRRACPARRSPATRGTAGRARCRRRSG